MGNSCTSEQSAATYPVQSRSTNNTHNSVIADQIWAKLVVQLEQTADLVRGERRTADAGIMQNKMQVYSMIYNASTRDPEVPEILYNNLDQWLQRYLRQHVEPRMRFAASHRDDELFACVAKEYASYRIMTKLASTLFGYLDQYHTRKKGVASVDRLYQLKFYDVVYNNVKDKLRYLIVMRMDEVRDGNFHDVEVLRAAVALFVEVGTAVAKSPDEATRIFRQDFANHYLYALGNYYRRQAPRMFGSDTGDFLKWMEKKYKTEHDMGLDLMSSTEAGFGGDKLQEEIEQVLDRELLSKFGRQCVMHHHYGFASLLEDEKEADLQRMYRLFKRSFTVLMVQELRQVVVHQGNTLISEYSYNLDEGYMAAEKPFVEQLLALNHKYRRLTAKHFDNNAEFLRACDEGITAILDQSVTRHDPHQKPRQTSTSEILAQYMDAALRGELKDIVDQFLELERYDNLVSLFSFLPDKDIFQEYYKSKLARRLLQTTINEEHEKYMLSSFQRKMGKSFTTKMIGMLNDLESKKQMEEKFEQKDGHALPCEFQCTVLTAGHWPAYKTEVLQVSPSLSACMDAFCRFYIKAHRTRKLNWIHALAQAQILVKFPKGTKDITMTVHQASVMVLLDLNGRLTLGDIATALKRDVKEVAIPQIMSLYHSKHYQLVEICDGEGNIQEKRHGFNNHDFFTLSPTFRSSKRRFHIAPAVVHTTIGDPTEDDLDARRKVQIDACVVRLMKSRRTLMYPELLQLTSEHLVHLFHPKTSQIKKRLEDLVNRGYIERDKEQINKFNYLA